MDETCPPGESKPEMEAPDHESSLEVVEMSAVEFFSSAFQCAERQASTAKGPRKRVHVPHYHGKSKRTQDRHKKRKRDLEAQGFLSLPEFFKRKATSMEQEESKAEVILNEESKAREEDRKCEEDGEHKKNPEKRSGDESGPALASIPAFEEEEEEEEEEAEAEITIDAVPIHTREEEEEEEEEEEPPDPEDHTTKTTTDERRAEVTPMAMLSQNLGNAALSGICWGPSWTILHESEGSDSESNGGNSTQSNHEDIHNSGTKELEGFRRGDSHDDNTTQQPMASVVDFLRDRARVQSVQTDLAARARLGDLDAVLRGRIAAMLALLNLFLDKSLSFTWKESSEVVAKSERRGTNRARSI